MGNLQRIAPPRKRVSSLTVLACISIIMGMCGYVICTGKSKESVKKEMLKARDYKVGF